MVSYSPVERILPLKLVNCLPKFDFSSFSKRKPPTGTRFAAEVVEEEITGLTFTPSPRWISLMGQTTLAVGCPHLFSVIFLNCGIYCTQLGSFIQKNLLCLLARADCFLGFSFRSIQCIKTVAFEVFFHLSKMN